MKDLKGQINKEFRSILESKGHQPKFSIETVVKEISANYPKEEFDEQMISEVFDLYWDFEMAFFGKEGAKFPDSTDLDALGFAVERYFQEFPWLRSGLLEKLSLKAFLYLEWNGTHEYALNKITILHSADDNKAAFGFYIIAKAFLGWIWRLILFGVLFSGIFSSGDKVKVFAGIAFYLLMDSFLREWKNDRELRELSGKVNSLKLLTLQTEKSEVISPPSLLEFMKKLKKRTVTYLNRHLQLLIGRVEKEDLLLNRSSGVLYKRI